MPALRGRASLVRVAGIVAIIAAVGAGSSRDEDLGRRPRETIRGWRNAAALMLLAGCGQGGLSGTFENETETTRYEFKQDGTARLSVLGASVPAEYVLEGDKVLVSSPQGTIVLRRKGDRLIGPMGLELRQRTD